MIDYVLTRLDALPVAQVYEVLALRQSVFIVEPAWPVAEIDGRDLDCLHLLGREDGKLVCYARLVPPAAADDSARIGRVLVAKAWRGHGLGAAVMREAMARLRAEYPGRTIRIAAQAHLREFYERLGFQAEGNVYILHDIAHLDMWRN
jgi:ElaA protein